MLRYRIRAVIHCFSALCLFLLLLAPATLAAQPQFTLPQCEELARKYADQNSVNAASWDALERAREQLHAIHDTLKGYVARLQANPEQSDQVIRAILTLLP